MTARQLAAKVGVSVRTVRFYVAERLLSAPEFRGRGTRYGRQHLLRLAAVRHLQHDKRLSLPIIRRHLEQIDSVELERLASALLPELAPPPSPLSESPPSSAAGTAPAMPGAYDTWQRIAILPGLEMHLHCAASSEIRSLAHEIIARLTGALAGSRAERTDEASALC